MGMCPDPPDPPDYAQEARTAQNIDLNMLPFQYRVDAAARLGIPLQMGNRTIDFTGLGEGDYQLQYADAMARSMLGIQQDFGEDYVRQRLAEIQQAQPEWVDTRTRLYNEIVGGLGQDPNRATAENLQQQVLSQLDLGGELDPVTRSRLQQQVRGVQAARGNVYGAAPIAEETGAVANAAETQRTARQKQALDFLVSGISPEDVAYRRNLQNMGNLGAFISGQTPTAQFAQLSGAQQGPAPFWQSRGPAMQNNAQGVAGFNDALYGAQQDLFQNTINPWVAGLGAGLQGVGLGMSFS